MPISTIVSDDGLFITTVNTNGNTSNTITTILYTDTSRVETTVRDSNGSITSITSDVENTQTGHIVSTTTYPSTSDYVISTTNSIGVRLDLLSRYTDVITQSYTIMSQNVMTGSFSSETFDAIGTSISTTDVSVNTQTAQITSIDRYTDLGSTITTVTDAIGNIVIVTTVIIDGVTGYKTTTTDNNVDQTTTSVTRDISGNEVNSATIDLTNSENGTISTMIEVISAKDGTTTKSTLINDVTGTKAVLVSSVVNVTDTLSTNVISNVLITYDSSGNYTTVTTDSLGNETTALSNAPIYAFYASGGFTFNEGYNNIEANFQSGVNQYDYTKAVQVSFNTQSFNRKLGIFKGSDNITLVADNLKTGEYAKRRYDASSDRFVDRSTGSDVSFNSITLTSTEFNAGISLTSQIISVGALELLYADFVSNVRSYFGYSGGFASLFDNAETFDISGGTTFGAAAFLELLSLSDISGTIIIPEIVECLRFSIDGNIFNNRFGLNSSSDVTDRNNYGVADGFMPGDMIWIPNGIGVHLSVGVESELVNTYLNNIGPIQLVSHSDSYLRSGALFSDIITTSLTNIAKTMNAPVLLVLSDSI